MKMIPLKFTKLVFLTALVLGSTSQAMRLEKADLNSQLINVASNGDLQPVAQCLAQGADINARDMYGSTALIHAALNGQKEICELLVARRALVNIENSNGWGALRAAVIKGDLGICQMLIDHKAKINEQDNEGMSVLMSAVWRGFKEICQLLIANNTDIHARDAKGNTALLWAAENGREEIGTLLIANGASVNAQDRYGFTPLMKAAKGKHREMCKLLVANGADVNFQNQSGETALLLAVQNCDAVTGELLLDLGADATSALILAAEKRAWTICKLCIAKGANLYARDKTGATALMIAAEYGYNEISESFLSAMVKPKKDLIDSMVALLGVARRRKAAQPLQVGRDVVGMITRAGHAEINEIKRQNKIEAEIEIKKIQYAKSREELLQYLNSL